jgi:hypothetical protein
MTGIDKGDKSLASMNSFLQGTRTYFAPELNMKSEAGNVDLPARDIYSLGITLYQMLTKTPQGDLLNLNYAPVIKDKGPKTITTKDAEKSSISEDEYRDLQRNPKKFYRYLGMSDEQDVKRAIPNSLFLLEELTKNLLFYNPSKQESWENLDASDPKKLSGPDTPWHLRPQDYEEVSSLVKVFDNFDLMMEIQELMGGNIKEEPGKLLKSFGKDANDKNGLWYKINQLR